MSRLADGGAHDPAVIAAAHDIVRGVRERDDVATMDAMLQFVRARMRYTPDPVDVELVKSPRVLLEESARDPGGKFVGDCDDASTLLASLLACVGIRSRFCVVPADGRRPGEWSHVYVSAATSDGWWISLDPIVRRFAVGEEAPSSALNGPRAYFPGALAGVGGSSMNGIGNLNGFRRGGVGALPDFFSSAVSSNVAAASSAADAGGMSPALKAILGLAEQAGSVYLSKYAKKIAPKPAAPVFISPGQPAPAAGMSKNTKMLLVAGGVVVAGVVVFSMMRRRRSNPGRRRR